MNKSKLKSYGPQARKPVRRLNHSFKCATVVTTPFTDLEIEQLEAWLTFPIFEGKAMTLDKLHGFLCAVASSPDMIEPSFWLPEALGGEPNYETLEQATAFVALMMKFYHHVAQTLADEAALNLILKPGVQTDQNLNYQTWCDGYILGWSLSRREWMTPDNSSLKKMTFPILLLSGAFKEDAESRGKEFMPAEEYRQLEQESANVLPDSIKNIYNFWLSKRKSSPAKRGIKVGRNDPCPCGSGKKYKQCCGMDKTLH